MLILPLRMESALETRPMVSMIIGLALLYQALVLPLFPSLQIDQTLLLSRNPYEIAFWSEMFLSLFRGATPLSALFLATFWLVIGRGLEHRIGSLRIMLWYLLGAGLVYLAGFMDLVRMEKHLWFGLGGTLACMGAAYYHVWEDDVTFFYFVLTPFHISAGFSTTASLFLIGVIQLILAIAQLPYYFSHESPPEGLVSAGLFTLTLPLVIALLCILSGLIRGVADNKKSRAGEPVG
ncbi:MAG: hypothetical protein JJU11_10840 [Candidatus Sumerlaeia bacterium]|nr:hypothetical protein [Candidatus Sumerlaeia bacterium]